MENVEVYSVSWWLPCVSSLRLAVRARLVPAECLPQRTRHRNLLLHVRAFAFAMEDAMKLKLIERASLRLLHDVRMSPDSRCVLCLCRWHFADESACQQAPGTCRWRLAFAMEDAMTLRQTEQACGCSTVRSGCSTQGACSSLPLALCGGECLPLGSGTCTCRWRLAFTMENAMTLQLIEQACGCSTWQGGVPTQGACSSLLLALCG